MNGVWLETLQKIMDSDLISKPRGFEIKEILNDQMKIDMHTPILSVIKRNLGYKFMAREAWWLMDGRNDVESIKDYSKAISSFSDDGYHFNGAYGPRIVDQWHYIVDSLISDICTSAVVSVPATTLRALTKITTCPTMPILKPVPPLETCSGTAK